MKLIVTFGGTREPIDGVRFISNFSTGSTGAFLTDAFREKGWEVLALHGKDAQMPVRPGPNREFITTLDLEALLKESLGSDRFDGIVHLAAISDYSLEAIEADGVRIAPNFNVKMKSETRSLKLHLKRNEKIISKIRGFSKNPNLILVGFKLTKIRLGFH